MYNGDGEGDAPRAPLRRWAGGDRRPRASARRASAASRARADGGGSLCGADERVDAAADGAQAGVHLLQVRLERLLEALERVDAGASERATSASDSLFSLSRVVREQALHARRPRRRRRPGGRARAGHHQLRPLRLLVRRAHHNNHVDMEVAFTITHILGRHCNLAKMSQLQ